MHVTLKINLPYYVFYIGTYINTHRHTTFVNYFVNEIRLQLGMPPFALILKPLVFFFGCSNSFLL